MGGNKAGPSPTMFLQKSEMKQQALKDVRDKAAKNKQDAIKAASEPLGLCLFIAIFILAAIVVPPVAIVLL